MVAVGGRKVSQNTHKKALFDCYGLCENEENHVLEFCQHELLCERFQNGIQA